MFVPAKKMRVDCSCSQTSVQHNPAQVHFCQPEQPRAVPWFGFSNVLGHTKANIGFKFLQRALKHALNLIVLESNIQLLRAL